ncbi:MAG: ribulokinase [Chitinophagaceae bacterium]|nr:MAG: ribulokinase [Chitinophagaceae bacterium]
MIKSYVIGVDYGTDSVRTVILDSANGDTIASSVFEYPRWKEQLYCDASLSQFRQHPSDYVEGLEATIIECLKSAGEEVAKNVRAISIDTTGSTPVAVDKTGTPLALLPEFAENPNAMFVLWKDHSATKEAAQINAHGAKSKINYLQYVGGIYSSEWFWAKLLFILRKDEAIRNGCYSWVEHCDWIPFLLTGGNDVHKMRRGVCAAGHKALWAPEFGGLPPDEFFTSLDPLLTGYTERLFKDTYTSSEAAGTISAEWSDKLGLSKDVVIGVGAFDAHMGAVGGQIEPYHLSKVMGTSTCDMLVAPVSDIGDRKVAGICGQVTGSVIPGMSGLEAGQSAFGDTYAWFRDLLSWPLKELLPNSDLIDAATAKKLAEELKSKMIVKLSEEASKIKITVNSELALDWFNGRRTPDANQELKAVIAGLNLASNAPRIFFALAEATCFGARKIVDRFNEQDVPVKGLIGLGGVAKKSSFVMQMMADVMNMPLRIHRSEQACATGAAMFAATAAGLYPKVEDAMNAMGAGFEKEYHPDPERVALFAERYKRFTKLGELIESQNKD